MHPHFWRSGDRLPECIESAIENQAAWDRLKRIEKREREMLTELAQAKAKLRRGRRLWVR
jgi:hypothetical protein